MSDFRVSNSITAEALDENYAKNNPIFNTGFISSFAVDNPSGSANGTVFTYNSVTGILEWVVGGGSSTGPTGPGDLHIILEV